MRLVRVNEIRVVRGKHPWLAHLAVPGWLFYAEGCTRLRPPIPVSVSLAYGLLGVKVSAASVVEVCVGRSVVAPHAVYRGVKLMLARAEYVDAPTAGYPIRVIAESPIDASALLLFGDPVALPQTLSRLMAAEADRGDTHMLPGADILERAGLGEVAVVDSARYAVKLRNPALLRAYVRTLIGVATMHDWRILESYNMAKRVNGEWRYTKASTTLLALLCHVYPSSCVLAVQHFFEG